MNANRANQQSISARAEPDGHRPSERRAHRDRRVARCPTDRYPAVVIASDTVRGSAGAGTSVRSCMTYTGHPRPARNQRLPVRLWRRLGVVGRSGCERDMDCRP
jgi:hypothetical protein